MFRTFLSRFKVQIKVNRKKIGRYKKENMTAKLDSCKKHTKL